MTAALIIVPLPDRGFAYDKNAPREKIIDGLVEAALKAYATVEVTPKMAGGELKIHIYFSLAEQKALRRLYYSAQPRTILDAAVKKVLHTRPATRVQYLYCGYEQAQVGYVFHFLVS